VKRLLDARGRKLRSLVVFGSSAAASGYSAAAASSSPPMRARGINVLVVVDKLAKRAYKRTVSHRL